MNYVKETENDSLDLLTISIKHKKTKKYTKKTF